MVEKSHCVVMIVLEIIDEICSMLIKIYSHTSLKYFVLHFINVFAVKSRSEYNTNKQIGGKEKHADSEREHVKDICRLVYKEF